MANLTPKQEASCHDYIKTGNKTEAYRLNYATKGMTENTLNVEAVKHFNIPKISLRVNELKEQLSQRHDLSKDKILDRLKQIILEQEVLGAEKIDIGAMNKAIDTVNKMMGYYEADNKQKTSHTIKTLDSFYEEQD